MITVRQQIEESVAASFGDIMCAFIRNNSDKKPIIFELFQGYTKCEYDIWINSLDTYIDPTMLSGYIWLNDQSWLEFHEGELLFRRYPIIPSRLYPR